MRGLKCAHGRSAQGSIRGLAKTSAVTLGSPFLDGQSVSGHARMGHSDNLRANDVASFGPFRLFAAERLLEKADQPRQLGGRALDILITLVERAGEVVTRKELISRVWPDVIVEEANLRVHVAGLRKALGDGHNGARYVANVPGRGYCFVAPVTRSALPRSLPQAR
jgi:DNA-binding winged helix-turn-helix (wHTH) protein